MGVRSLAWVSESVSVQEGEADEAQASGKGEGFYVIPFSVVFCCRRPHPHPSIHLKPEFSLPRVPRFLFLGLDL